MKNVLERSLSLFLAITIIFSSAYIGLNEVDFSSVDLGGFLAVKSKAASIDDLTFTLNGGGISYSVTDCDESAEGELVVPDTYNDLPVTSIGYYAFWGCDSLASITIPDSVTGIGNYAFRGCTNLESVTIPDSVTSIGESAFRGCTSLTSVTIPDSVTTIGSNAFYYCTGLTSVYITDIAVWCGIIFDAYSANPLFYARNLYLNGSLVTDLVIPDGVTSIGTFAFYFCSSLKSVTIPSSVTNIGYRTFYACTSLSSVTIPSSVTSIGVNAFSDCKNLASITVESANKSFCSVDGVLFNKAQTTLIQYPIGKTTSSYIIPDSVTSISSYAFRSCKSLTSITIPDSAISIGDSAFEGCTGVNSITIPDSVISIGYNVFFNTGYYKDNSNWDNDVLYIGNHLIEANSSLSGEYTIKNATKIIGDYAFYSCTGLTSINIPDSVTNIGNYAFDYCNNLKNVFFSGSECKWANISIGKHNTRLVNAIIDYSYTGHSYGDWVVDLKSTCIEDGSRSKTCSLCGNVVSEVIYATGHQNIIWITEQEPTCIATGYEDGYCLDCTELIDTRIIPEKGHSYSEWMVDTESSCTETGSKHKICSVCSDVVVGTINLAEHSYSEDWTIDLAPTCTEKGSKSHHCTVCGYKSDVMAIEAYGHEYGEWLTEKKPTCTSKGSKRKTCFVCGDTVIREVEPNGHSYSTEWTIDIKPTCTEEGSKSHHCTVCGDKADITAIKALGHDYIVVSTEAEHPHLSIFKCTRCSGEKQEGIYSSTCIVCNFSYDIVDDESCKITGYIGTGSIIKLPSFIDERVVATTTTGAFKNNITVTSVIIEDGVQSIGALSFLGCTSLSKIIIPASVTSIGASAFHNCASDFTIYCFRDSYAMQYAIDNSLNYVVMDIGETENSTIDYSNNFIFSSKDGVTNLENIIYTPATSTVSAQASLVNDNNEFFGTGSKITVVDNGVSSEYTLIVNGDTNGDSVCDVLDTLDVAKATNGHTTLDGVYKMAADSNLDDVVDITDYQDIVNKAVS